MIRVFVLFVLMLFAIQPVLANDSAGSFLCEALAQNKSYQKDKSFQKLIEGKEGWIFRTKTDFNDKFKINQAIKPLTRLNKVLQEHDMQLVMALLPARGMMHYDLVDYPAYDHEKAIKSYTELVRSLKEIGIPVAAIDDFSAKQDFFYKRDHHWNAEGAKLLAQKTAEEIRKLSIYSSIPKKSFRTEQSGTIFHHESFSEFANKICRSNIQFQQVPTYKTFPVDAALFDNEKPPDIALIGTSNSVQYASDANFEGFLKQYIGADVQNFSVSGGGIDTAMLDWLSSDDYKAHKPKIIIWEVPAYQNFQNLSLYQQVIPAIYGDCENNATATDVVKIENDRFQIFVDIKDQNITTKGHYLFLKFSDFKELKFRITKNYTDGSKSLFDFKRTKFYQPDGVFFLEFNQQEEKILSFITALMPKGTEGGVTARICRY